MSNLIPPLLSSSPPPIVGPLDEDDDDEFGDFRAAADSYDCDDFSPPLSPQKSPEKELNPELAKVNLDINSNKSQKVTNATEMPTQNGLIVNEEVNKDFQDRRKSSDDDELKECESGVNSSDSQSVSPPEVFDGPKITADEEVVDEVLAESSTEQDCKISSCDVEDDFADLQSAGHEIQTDLCIDEENRVDSGHSDLNSFCHEENAFDAFSESVHEKTSNSGDLSELNESNEIKSEHDPIDEINCEITEDNKDNSSKDINYDNLSESSLSLRVCETDPKLSDDEFGDFENHFKEVDQPADDSNDEFDDFVNPFPSTTEEHEVDDFGDFASSDFGEFSSQSVEKPAFLELDEKNAVDRSEAILKGIFPPIESEISEFEVTDETKENAIFNELKDVTETNALVYQWSKSNSQKMFFKALNIDTRNILYGPAWNCSMPRFAANLGLTPLEPVKTEILTPTPAQNFSSPSNSSQKSNGDIPTAQFDWNGSGLINPLDSTSADRIENVPEDPPQPQPLTDFLPITSDKPESIPSLFDNEILEKKSVEPKFGKHSTTDVKTSNGQSDSFSPFQSPKLIPLRETHISTEANDKPGWLQPTIVTPDLPRKATSVDQEDDDEFDDFQMVLPENRPNTNPEAKSDAFSLPDLSEFDMTSRVPSVDRPSHNHEHILGVPLNSGPIKSQDQKQTTDDDEFTEFHSSLPQIGILKPAPQTDILKPVPQTDILRPAPQTDVLRPVPQTDILKPVPQTDILRPVPQTDILRPVPQTDILRPLQSVPLELLKPTIQYSAPIAQINWPDPGVTDEDIKNIELTYSRKEETTVKAVGKENSLDDDEWSDFVSVTNSSPVRSLLPERTATPDLPLSVLNLNNVQAPKQPIPVITPSGLVQTKLSSNLTLKTKSVVQTSVQPNLFRPPTTLYQPSIISSQYAAKFPSSSTTVAPPASSQSQDDDEDWSDFVSSQPPPQANGYQQKSGQRPPPINWTNATTNIIMNPTHFEAFKSYAPPPNKKSAMPARSAIPSISAIPDLEFIAPKNRTSKK